MLNVSTNVPLYYDWTLILDDAVLLYVRHVCRDFRGDIV